MAKDVITRFKLETTQYDSKLKEEAKKLSDYSKTATQAKEGFNQFTKANVDAAKALGTMATSATNTKERIKELVGAYNIAAKTYNSLTKEQQQGDWAQALAGSLRKLQQQIKDTKQEMQDLDSSMKNAGGGGLFAGLGGKMSGALQVFAGNMYTKAAEAVANLGSEMFATVKQGVELAKAGEGIRLAFNRLNDPALLDGLREATHGTVTDLELMKAAVRFNDFNLPLEELGTMLAFAQQKAKDTGQSVDYLVESIVNGLGRQSTMILDNLGLSQAEVKARTKETGDMTKAVGAIIREQMAKAGDYVETAADRAAQANVSLQNKMEELGRKFAPVEEASNQLWTSMKIGILDVVGGPLARLLNGLTEAGRQRDLLFRMQGGGEQTVVDKKLANLRGSKFKEQRYNAALSGFDQDIRVAEFYKKRYQKAGWAGGSVLSDATRRFGVNIVSAEDFDNLIKNLKIMRSDYAKRGRDIINAASSPAGGNTPITPTTTGGKGGKGGHTTADNTPPPEGSIAAQEQLVSKLTKKWKEATDQVGRDGYLKQLNDAKKTLDQMQGKAEQVKLPELAEFDKNEPQTSLADQIRAELADAKAAIDEASLHSLMKFSIENGIEGIDFTTLQEKMAEGLDIPDSAWENLQNQINEKLQNGIKPIKLDFATGELSNGKSSRKGEDRQMQQVVSGLQSVAGGLQQMGIELPKSVQMLQSMISGVMTVVQGVQTIITATEVPAETTNTAALSANTAAVLAMTDMMMVKSMSSIASFGFANGGVVKAARGFTVPGTHFSGDVTPILANAGEVVLNRSQVGNLASILEGGSQSNLHLETRVDAEDLIFVLNNNAKRRGRGAYIKQ